MRIAILGGTFDPVHVGHLFVADEVLHQLGFDRIVFVPTYQAPHKATSPRVAGDDRVEMLRIATADRPEFVVDTFEVDHASVSYTVHTVRHVMRDCNVTGKPGLIIGSDLTKGFEKWKSASAIAELAELIVVRRPGYEPSPLRWEYQTVENALVSISSSDIRSRVRDGSPYRYLVPPDVADYIHSRGLYRTTLPNGAGRFTMG